jgi:hypothetical protein
VYRLALQAKDAGPSSDQVDRDDGGSSMSDDEILLRAREAFAENFFRGSCLLSPPSRAA